MTETLAPPVRSGDHGDGAQASAPPTPLPPRPRRRRRDFDRADAGIVLVTILSSLAVVWLLFSQLTLLSGPFGFLVCWVALFVILYWVVNLQLHGRLDANDRTVAALVILGSLITLVPLVLVTVYVVSKGWGLLSVHIFLHDQHGVGPLSPPGSGGVGHAIVGTLEQAGIAAVIGVPLAVMTAVFLNEVGGRLTRTVRIVVTAMSGVPAIVAGIFIYSICIVSLGEGFSGFAAALALTVILLPLVTRGTEEVLKVVPNELREASSALGAHEWRTVWSVVLPTARPGITTAVLMGIARVVGEAAPLLVTVLTTSILNANPLHGPQQALPLLTYTQIKLPLRSAIALGLTAALVLYLIVFVLFVLARLLGSVHVRGGLRFGRRKFNGQDMDDAAMEGALGGLPL
jgi:phosphate transport system permease protein